MAAFCVDCSLAFGVDGDGGIDGAHGGSSSGGL